MSEKTARKFDKLLTAYKTARGTSKAASAATREVKALNGEALTIAALASKAGVKAVESELAALRDERRALKRLAACATRYAESRKAGKSDQASATGTPDDDKAKKTKKADKSAKPAPRSKNAGKAADGPAAARQGKTPERPAGQE